MRRGDRIEDEIKPIGEGVEVLRVQRYDKVMRAKAARILFFRFGWLRTVTSAPIEAASLTAMWPNPPNLTTPTRWPEPTLKCLSGE